MNTKKGAAPLFTGMMVFVLSVLLMITVVAFIVPYFNTLKDSIDFKNNKENLLAINNTLIVLKDNYIGSKKQISVYSNNDIEFNKEKNKIIIKQNLNNQETYQKTPNEQIFNNLVIKKENNELVFELDLTEIVDLNESFIINAKTRQKINFEIIEYDQIPKIEISRANTLKLRKSCKEIKLYNPEIPDGVYLIQPNPNEDAFEVYCDMTIDGGGWTLFSYTHNYNDLDYTLNLFEEYGEYSPYAENGNATLGEKFLDYVDVYDILITDLDNNQPYVPGGKLVYVNVFEEGEKVPWGCMLTFPCGVGCGSAQTSGLDLRGFTVDSGEQEWEGIYLCSSSYSSNQWTLGYRNAIWLNSELDGVYIEYYTGANPSSARRSAMIKGDRTTGVYHKVWLR